jgi:extracellular elastinolytic metalloproteinase
MRGSQIASWASIITAALAHPYHDAVRHSSNPLQARQLSGALENFRPRQRSQYVEAAAVEGEIQAATSSSNSSALNRRQANYVQAATDLVRELFPQAEFRQVTDNYISGSGIGHVYFKQTLFGYDIDDADFNVNVCILLSEIKVYPCLTVSQVNEDGTIFSYGNSFYTGPLPESAPEVPQLLEPTEVVADVASTLGLPIDPAEGEIVEEDVAAFRVEGLANVESAPQGQLVYYRDGANNLVPAWRLETDVTDNWLTTYIQADGSNEVLAVTDYVADSSATYEVL